MSRSFALVRRLCALTDCIRSLETKASTTNWKGIERSTYFIYLVLQNPCHHYPLISFTDSFLVYYYIPGSAEESFQRYYDLLREFISGEKKVYSHLV